MMHLCWKPLSSDKRYVWCAERGRKHTLCKSKLARQDTMTIMTLNCLRYTLKVAEYNYALGQRFVTALCRHLSQLSPGKWFHLTSTSLLLYHGHGDRLTHTHKKQSMRVKPQGMRVQDNPNNSWSLEICSRIWASSSTSRQRMEQNKYCKYLQEK